MAGKKKAENFMKDVTTEKEWESLCDYQVLRIKLKSMKTYSIRYSSSD